MNKARTSILWAVMPVKLTDRFSVGLILALLWLVALMPAARAADAVLPQPADLRQEAALVQRAGQPLVILFSVPGCSYCVEVRNNYLAPLAGAANRETGPVIREIDLASTRQIRGFNGEVMTEAEFGKRYKVRVSPTVLMLDEAGATLTEPLVGSGMGGFYGAYFDQALTAARATLQQRRAGGQRPR